MRERRDQDDALSVRETSTREPTDGAVEKILVSIQLHDVIVWDDVRQHSIPGLVLLTVKVTVHGNFLREGGLFHSRWARWGSRGARCASSAISDRHGGRRHPTSVYPGHLTPRHKPLRIMAPAARRVVSPHAPCSDANTGRRSGDAARARSDT